MFVANHLSMIDIMLVLMVVKNPFVFVGKRELEKIPLFNYIYRRAAILVDRESAKSRKNVYHRAQRKLDHYKHVPLKDGVAVQFQPQQWWGAVPKWRY